MTQENSNSAFTQDNSTDREALFPVSRERLYKEVWSEPMTKVAERYRVSSSFLARVCTDLNVPRPQRGYWAKLAVGIESKQPPLPEARPGDLLEWSRGATPRRATHGLPKPPAKIRARTKKRMERPTEHHLLHHAKELFESGRESDVGYLKPAKKLLPDIIVSKESLIRALSVANELFLHLGDRGHHVVLAPSDRQFWRHRFDVREAPGKDPHYLSLWSPMRPTIVFVGTVAIGITIFEMTEAVEARWKDGKYIRLTNLPSPKRSRYAQSSSWTHKHDLPSGRLCILAYSPYPGTEWTQQWRETQAGDLSTKFSAIAKLLEREAGTIANLVEEAEKKAEIERQRHEAEWKRWQAEEAERKRIRAIKESREELFSVIEAWAQANHIESFFKEIEQRTHDLDAEQRIALQERLQQARELIGDISALRHFLAWKSPQERMCS